LPLEVLTVVLREVTVPFTPPLSAPFEEFITHCMGRLAKLKLPLLCAKPAGANDAAITNTVATNIIFFTMSLLLFILQFIALLAGFFLGHELATGLPTRPVRAGGLSPQALPNGIPLGSEAVFDLLDSLF
jgi:hypothetical protein